eukprot:69548-Chlamydomonas_euryale.AAC.1
MRSARTEAGRAFVTPHFRCRPNGGHNSAKHAPLSDMQAVGHGCDAVWGGGGAWAASSACGEVWSARVSVSRGEHAWAACSA